MPNQGFSLKHTRYLQNFVSIKLPYFGIDHITLRNTYKVEPELLFNNYSYQKQADGTMLFLTSEKETISG